MRVYTFTERAERSLVDRMRDLDAIADEMRNLYPDHTWSRSDLLTLFFLDDLCDRVSTLVNRENGS